MDRSKLTQGALHFILGVWSLIVAWRVTQSFQAKEGAEQSSLTVLLLVVEGRKLTKAGTGWW